jgi:SAM-dependent methyltransferase
LALIVDSSVLTHDYLGRSVGRRERLAKRARRRLRPRALALHRTAPLSQTWGSDRGKPIDRYYIEQVLAENRNAIRGNVIEVKHSTYSERFGSDVRSQSILDVDPLNEHATIVTDLTQAHSVPANSFDCFILTQTLQYDYDVRPAIAHAHRILRPGGVLLCTLPSVSRMEPGSLGAEFWRFTAAACTRLFGEAFGEENVAVRARGNVLVSIAFLAGMATEELRASQLEEDDEYFPLLVTVRANKARDGT